MRIRRLAGMAAAGIVLLAGASAHAAAAGATYSFDCPNSGFQSLALVSFNAPAFKLITSSSGGTTVLPTFTIVFPANPYAPLMLKDVLESASYESCKLAETVIAPSTTSGGSNTVYTWTFNRVHPLVFTGIGTNSSNADSAGANTPTALMQAEFDYLSVTLTHTN